MKNIFVDGYNVINSWSELNKIKEYSYESSRNKLIEILSNYAVYRNYRVFIIFDAHMVIGSIEKKERVNNNVMVVFTKEGETADSFIERTVNDIGRSVEVCVVTSDSLEQQVIFGRGAIRMSSIEFYKEVQSTRVNIQKRIHKGYSKKKFELKDSIDTDILEKLEKIRRSE
ncbi:NYN domain-containing protein [Clostridium fermenticellae]|uniref:NYN domain-containing protein n=1 Tax=Clostridium fermenticellae TaxID=2068654 RepID=A0A386H0Z4_9CLOT|nr:NYN domain-containing protein [Clostridium fermenticellae]AYD39235.1 NYN domain-containing protein [Clostridium fermenticellae]